MMVSNLHAAASIGKVDPSPLLQHLAITRLRTRSAAVCYWRDYSLSAYERDLVTNEKV